MIPSQARGYWEMARFIEKHDDGPTRDKGRYTEPIMRYINAAALLSMVLSSGYDDRDLYMMLACTPNNITGAFIAALCGIDHALEMVVIRDGEPLDALELTESGLTLNPSMKAFPTPGVTGSEYAGVHIVPRISKPDMGDGVEVMIVDLVSAYAKKVHSSELSEKTPKVLDLCQFFTSEVSKDHNLINHFGFLEYRRRRIGSVAFEMNSNDNALHVTVTGRTRRIDLDPRWMGRKYLVAAVRGSEGMKTQIPVRCYWKGAICDIMSRLFGLSTTNPTHLNYEFLKSLTDALMPMSFEDMSNCAGQWVTQNPYPAFSIEAGIRERHGHGLTYPFMGRQVRSGYETDHFDALLGDEEESDPHHTIF